MNEDAFLDRFAAGAAGEYHWTVLPDGRLRAALDVENEMAMCPVSAQYTLETGIITVDDMANIAATWFGLSVPIREQLFMASDGIGDAHQPYRHRLRQRLLQLTVGAQG